MRALQLDLNALGQQPHLEPDGAFGKNTDAAVQGLIKLLTEEAKANAVSGLPMVQVATIDDALAALQALREKRTPPLC